MKLRIVAIILLLSLLLFFGFKKVSPNKNKEQSTNIEQLSIIKYIPENNKLLFISNLDSFNIVNNIEKDKNSTNIDNWNASYGWGNHASAGYLTSTGSIGSHSDVTIATLQDGQLLKYSVGNARWENWTPNYLTSYTETDPVFAASAAGGITGTNIANWNTAYNWGNHASAGYLTAESDTLATVTGRGATTTTDITTTGKIYYSNNFADLTALNAVNPTTYHGMFAHVHAEGHGYFAHAGAWTQLLDTGSSINELADVNTGTISTGDVLTWSGSAWAASAPTGGGGGSGANVTISDTIPPGSPSAGDLWWESDTGRLKIYYQDTDSSQWVDTNPPLAASGSGGSGSTTGNFTGNFTGNVDAGVVTSDVFKKNVSQSESNLISISELKAVVAASADFAAFKTNIAALTDN